jgi:hypothetical protein
MLVGGLGNGSVSGFTDGLADEPKYHILDMTIGGGIRRRYGFTSLNMRVFESEFASKRHAQVDGADSLDIAEIDGGDGDFGR